MDQGRRGGDESSDALERIYDAALEPDRFQDLLTTWQQQLEASEKAGGSGQFDHHLDRAIQIAELSLARWEAEMAKDEYDIHGDSRPAMIVSHHGKVLDANAAASAAYGIDPPMAMSELPFDGYTMEEIGARLLQGASTSILRTVRTDSGTAVAIYLMALGAGKSVLRTTDLVWSDALENVLRGAFGLTDAELAVTRLIAEGHSVADAAEMRGASITTVRAQIRAIYGKTGSESLNELVRMVMGASPKAKVCSALTLMLMAT